MKTIVSSFGGSWFRRCLSMLLCFCMVLSLCPIPQHAAASDAGEIQEVSQPVETQPAPQPVETQPTPQPAETQPAPQPVETQPAPQPEQTQPAPQPEETQPVTVPEETQPVTVPEETQEVTEPEETQEVTEPEETQEVTEPEETQEVTEPEETQEATEPEETQEVQPLVVTGWQWVDEEGYINPETNELLINFASAEQLVTAEDLLFVLPYEILATVEGEEETLTLGEWLCSEYPAEGAYQGEYVFKTSLPEGYVLAEDAAQLEITVVFESLGAALYADEPHAHSYVNGICSDETCTDPYDAPIQTDGVYQIANAGNLFWFANYCNESDAPRSARLLNSIVIPEKADGSQREWTPIGTSSLPYTGTFDGKGFTISGLYFNDSNTLHVGLFGCVEGGTISGVTVQGSFTGYNAGGICGYQKSGTIRNCQNLASVNAKSGSGGICGASRGTIEHCQNSGSIQAKDGPAGVAYAGGICGYLDVDATIKYCSNSGTVSGAGAYFGGIAGNSFSSWNGELKDCWNSGSIGNGESSYVGGIIGTQHGNYGTIANCYSSGTVSGFRNVSPICPFSNGTLTNCYYQADSETVNSDGTTAKTAEEFASGEVAYLLNANRSPLIWIQNLDTDSYPRLGSEEQYRVYKTDYCPTYSNDEYNTNPHSAPEEGTTVCSVCGAQFVASAEINGVTSYHTTFLGAYGYAVYSGHGTLTLLADVVNTNVPEGNTLIFYCPFNLNLNGQTLNVNADTEVNRLDAKLNILGSGTLNLENGKTLKVNGGTVNIQGGTICGNIQVNQSYNSQGTLNISGGSLNGNIEVNDALLNITGGEFVDLSSNKMLRELLNDGYWFYTSRTGGEGSYTYSGLVKYSKLDTASYTGTLYVGPHDHSYTYTTITDTEHKGTCGCGKEDNGQHKFENGFCTSCDTYQEPKQDDSGVYQIANAGNLFWFAAKVNKNSGSRSISGKLTADITIPDGRTWTPIGNNSYEFAGQFDGNGKTISGLNINDSSMAGVGLFGYVGSGGRVFNLTVANSNFYGNNPVGGICGNNKGTITGCTSSANVSGTQNVGGICGNNASSGKITDCSNSGTVNGTTFVGGICGNNSGSVTNCFNIGTVPGKSGAGSIYGRKNNNGTASNCYYLAASETDNGDGTFGKTEAQFKSGEVAYLLNGSKSDGVWGQTIGSQDYPVLNGDAVYRALKCDNATVAYYINGTEDITLGHEAPGEDGNCPVCHQAIVASVTDIQGTATYYTSLEDASKVADDAEGSTLKLLSNVTTNSFSISVHKEFTLDLNGKAVDLGTYYVYVYGDLTITGGEGSALTVNALKLSDGSTLNIQGGSITGNITGDSSANSVSLNITGGSISGTVETTNATCNISGGSLSDGVKATGGALTITGGSITGKVENYKGATLSVTGGEFTELSHNGPLYTLPADGYWFYYNRNVDEEGNVTYEKLVPFNDMGTTGENGNAVPGPVYVGPHSHDFVFTDINWDYHDYKCTGCLRQYYGEHTDADSDGLCDVCGTIEVHYKDVDGRDRTQRCFPITADTTELKEGATSWYVVMDENLVLNQRITVNGSVNLILMDNKSLTVDGGIEVGSGKSLAIYGQTNGTGSLTCQNCEASAGIGGTRNGACGSVTINGGIITTTGGINSAGIGGSGNFGQGFVNGTIQINGGTVKATGGSCAPGIGGGRGRNAGTIVINGGTVTATGKNGAPGIGGGIKESYYPGANQDGDGGNVSISNATVIANGIGGPATGGSLSASNSVIITDYTKHQTNTFTNSVVFKLENDAYAGEVYGNVTLSSDLTLDTGKPMTLNMSFNGNVGSLTLTNGAKLILGSGTTLKLEGNGSFPNGVTVSGGYLLDILADGWAFFYDEAGSSIIPLSATQYTTFPETDESPLVYLRQHTHSWTYSDINEQTHTKKCACMGESVMEEHTKGSDGFCTLCGAGVAGYVDANGNDMGNQACFAITASSTTWGEAGETTWYVVKDKEVNISDRINVTGNVNLILAENCTLNAQKGIDASAEGSSITIWAQSVAQSVDGSTGKLIAKAPNKQLDATKAAIAGTVTINGGVITASGDGGAADIGGNQDKGARITINGGYVKAIGAEDSAVKFGAGIGSGGTSEEETQITITGGIVYASSLSGAGIGSGFGENGTTTVKITGGTVCGTSDTGAGIGESAYNHTSTFVIIEGGTVTACGTTYAFKSDPYLSEYVQFKLSTGEDKDSLTAVDYSARTAVEGYDGYTASKAVRIEPCGTEENPHNRVCKDVGDGIWHNSICNWCGYVEDAQAHTVPGEDGRCTACDALIVASVTGNDFGPLYCSDFFVACEAAYEIDGSTLTLLQDVDISIPGISYSSYIDKRMTLNLNGKNLKLGSITFIIREDAGNYGNLTVTGDGMLSLNEPVTVNDGCTLTIEGGTIDAAINVRDGGKVNITGGSFEKANGFDITNSDSISITGGEFIQNALSTSYYLKSLLGKDENGDYAYWYYKERTETASGYTYSDPISLAEAEQTSNSVKLYVGSHEHKYVNDGTCVCGKMRPVKMSVDGESVYYYDSLDAALEYLQSYPVTARGEITLRDDVSCGNLVIPEKVTLEVNSGVKLDAGAVYVRGSLKNNGTIMGHVYYLLELTDCTAQCTNDGIQRYDGSTYARAGTEIELAPVPPDGKMFVGWQCAQATIEDDSFKMPNKATSVTARIETIVATVTIDDVTTPYSSLYEAFDAVNDADDKVIIELKADAKLDHGTIRLDNRYCNVIFSGGSYKIYGEEPGDWEHRSGYIGVLSGADLTIESGTIASSAFLHCGSGSIVTVKNGSIDTLIVEGGKLTVEPAVDEENNPVGNIRVENLEVRGFSVGDVQLNGGSYGSLTVPEDNDVSDLLADGFAYKLTDGSWEDANNGTYTEAISAATVVPVPVTITSQPDATKTMTYGDVESLSVTANREEASYQWYEVIPNPSETAQTKAITGETGSTLKLSTFDAGTHEFFCEATVDGYNAKSSPAKVTVNPRTLDIQWDDWDDDTFEYDGQYHPKFTIGNTANGDQVFPVLQSGNEPQKNVGSYTVGVIDFVANGTDGFSKHGNYKLGATYRDFSITAKPITVNITANGGTYGEPFDGATAELVGVVAGETVPVTLTYTSASGYNSTTVPTDAGTYKVKASINNGNYELTGVKEAEFVVNKATNSWTTEPTVSNWTYGDSSTVNPGEASFGTVQVTYYKGETKLTAAPTDAGSYKVIFTVEGTDNYKELTKELDFTINRRDLTIIGAKVYNNGRAYDGTKVVELESFTYSNVVTGDTVRVGFPDVGLQGTLNSADAGTYSQVTLPQNLLLTDNGDGSAKNYNLVMLTEPVATDVTISPKKVTFSGITAENKDYDGTKNVTLDDSQLSINGLIDGDDLSVSVTAAFEDANAGQNKTVTFTNPTLTGEDSGNYVLAQSGNQTGTTATIEPLGISIENVTVEDKVYDGTTDATITSSGSLSKNLDGENLTIVPGTASFETAGAGNGKTVSFQGFDLGGSAQGNYQLSGQPASTTANITPATVKQLTLKSTSATYDGNAKVPEITEVTSKNDLTLTGSDYQVSYQDASGSTVTELKNAGEYTVTVIGTGNFQGTATANFTIKKAEPDVTPAELTITYGTKLSGCDLSGFKAYFDGSVLPGSFAFDEPDTMPQVSDSDTTRYKLTFTPADTVNFKNAPVEVTVTVNKKELTVDVAVKDKQYDGLNDAEFSAAPKLIGLVSGDEDKVTLTNGDATFKTVAVGQNIPIIFTDFSISGDASGNYKLTQPTGITASIYNTFTAVKGENGNYTVSTNEWTNQDFVVTGLNGSKLSLTNTADGTWSDTLTVTTEGEGDLSFYIRSSDGAISNQATEHYKLDKTAPTGTILFDEKDETESSPTACYKNQDVAVTLTGDDALSGVASVIYFRSSTEQTETALKDVTDWTEETDFTVEVEDKTVCYVYSKVVDNAGNVAYFRANWIVFDTTAPVITGVENGATYYTTQTAAVSDDYLDAVTLNEEAKTSPVKLTGDVDATYIIKATDKAGNETTVTVTMKPISSITEPFKDLTTDNVTEEDRKDLEDADELLSELLDTATDENEKQKLQEELDKLKELLDVLDNAKDVEEILKNLPDSVEPDADDDTVKAIEDARKALDELTDHEEDLVDDKLIGKLERLEDELVDYKFLEAISVWNLGSGIDASFVANGRLDKLEKVLLNENELTTGFTKDTPRTTIVLKAALLQSLELGEYTLKLVYTNGSTETTFSVKQSINYLDLTDESDFDDQTEVDIGGKSYPIEELGGKRYVNLPESGELLTTYTYLSGTDAGTHENYPIGMRVFRIHRSEDGTTVEEITEFIDLLQYSGCSIRVSGKRGIRMITSMTKSNKAALKGKGLAGFTMLEYGTVVQWADSLGADLTLDTGNHNYAYKRGVADPVFGTSGDKTQYTNVLVGFDLEECSKDIVMRPYIILQDAEGNQYTLYGGLVTRSISYIAWQNRDTYKSGTAAYKYVHELMGDLDTPAEGG